MNALTIQALEFDRIQQELATFAACQLGKDLALKMQPLPTLDEVRRAAAETTEAKTLIGSGRSVPFGGIQDVRLPVERAASGGVLRPDQLMAVAETIYGCRALYRFLTEHKAEAPLLCRHADAFGRFDDLEVEIRRCIDRGAVADKASRNLKQIRSEIGILESRIQDRLSGLVRQYRQHLQEALVTTRNGRYVIPVKASSRAAVPGAVHGASASGSTLFVEPEAISRLCEELESWRAMETAEIEQVLIGLSGQVADHAHGLGATLGAVAQLDLVFARARLSAAWDARPVQWNEQGLIDLQEARHPLLGRGAVGNRIHLAADCRMLIVTGPNTGGKTLLLKTLGILVLVAQSGLHLPVADGSTLCFFTDVFVDIGDRQSLEQSLSTFSGHIANVAPMLSQAGPQSLILLDELGSGTDPHEGTGLGIALLEAFLRKHAYTLVTTHLREIKEFGRVTPGCAYAGMGFDGETLQPTYHLLYGTLGESHGLAIAARAGLPAEVVERASQLVGGHSEGGPSADGPVLGLRGSSLRRRACAAPDAYPSEPLRVSSGRPNGSTDPAAPGTLSFVYGGGASAPAPVAQSRAVDPLSLVTMPLSQSRCRVWREGREQEITIAEPVRKLWQEGLVVGDRIRVRDGLVVEVAKRQRVLVSRDADTMRETVEAANATRLLLLLSARQPDFHTSVLARHLLYAERQGVTPVICVTKADLVPVRDVDGWLKPFRANGFQTVVVSGLRRTGLHDLTALLTGQVTAVMGEPGVGKRTLLSALAGAATQVDSAASLPDRAKHWRSVPRAIPLASDTWLIDMPGLRELGVWKPDLSGGFREFSAFASRCNRPGCMHRLEPGCAVRQAAEEGHLEKRRYDQYLQLLQHMRLA